MKKDGICEGLKDKEEGGLGSLQQIDDGKSEKFQKSLFFPCKQPGVRQTDWKLKESCIPL